MSGPGDIIRNGIQWHIPKPDRDEYREALGTLLADLAAAREALTAIANLSSALSGRHARFEQAKEIARAALATEAREAGETE